ncbi:MAG: ribonuclease P protein component [Candidatus Geothermincolia bacterium]
MPPREGPGLRWITASSEMRSIRKQGKLYRGGLVFIWACPGDPGEEAPGVAVVTGRGFRNAVTRNLAKRRLRGGLLDRRQLLEQGKCYLVEGRRGVEKADYQLLVKEIDDILSRTRNCLKIKGSVPDGKSR